MTSSRLPGKVLREIAGEPMLFYQVERLKESKSPIFIATTQNPEDAPVERLCRKLRVSCFRGDEHDVLGRMYQCAIENKIEVITRVTADCPLIDGRLVGEMIEYWKSQNDPKLVLSNAVERKIPRGLGFEIFHISLLERAYRETKNREHVTTFFYELPKEEARLTPLPIAPEDLGIRLTVDEEPDFQLVQQLIENESAHNLDYHSILTLFEKRPELKKINADVHQKTH